MSSSIRRSIPTALSKSPVAARDRATRDTSDAVRSMDGEGAVACP